ncbi:transmembrane protein 272-like isoform 2-T2 [Pholidichthys leucotaenia]
MEDNGRPEPTCRQQTVMEWCKLVIFFIAAIAFVVVGFLYSFYFKECPRQPFIPIYFSVLCVILVAQYCWWNWIKKNCCCLFTVFAISWFIAGNIMVYSIYEPNYNKNTTETEPYCEKNLYLTAFWFNNLIYIITGVVFLLFTCCCCIRLCANDDHDDTQTLLRYTVVVRS